MKIEGIESNFAWRARTLGSEIQRANRDLGWWESRYWGRWSKKEKISDALDM